jgi:hypothetical protein
LAIDHQRIAAALLQRRSGFGQGGQTAFDAAGIEEHREAELVAVPELLIQFQEGIRFLGAVLTQQADVTP